MSYSGQKTRKNVNELIKMGQKWNNFVQFPKLVAKVVFGKEKLNYVPTQFWDFSILCFLSSWFLRSLTVIIDNSL